MPMIHDLLHVQESVAFIVNIHQQGFDYFICPVVTSAAILPLDFVNRSVQVGVFVILANKIALGVPLPTLNNTKTFDSIPVISYFCTDIAVEFNRIILLQRWFAKALIFH